jgi:hypothetical protein
MDWRVDGIGKLGRREGNEEDGWLGRWVFVEMGFCELEIDGYSVQIFHQFFQFQWQKPVPFPFS